jgi:transposase
MEPDTTNVRRFTRAKPVRAPLPAHLPRERVVLPSPTSCPCCGGKLVKLGETITETLESIPRTHKVTQTVREKFSCRTCEMITQPTAPKDQRTTSTYIFGAICPRLGKAAGLVLPRCNVAAMNLHLAEKATAVAPAAHAVLLLDQAGWHLSQRLVVVANITLMPLPAKCPELNPTENVWQFMRDNWLSNQVFPSYDAIVDHCCDAWNRLADQPWRIMSIGLRNWAHGF